VKNTPHFHILNLYLDTVINNKVAYNTPTYLGGFSLIRSSLHVTGRTQLFMSGGGGGNFKLIIMSRDVRNNMSLLGSFHVNSTNDLQSLTQISLQLPILVYHIKIY